MCAKTIYEYTPEMERWQIAPGSIDEVLRFEDIFGNSNPVEIEIGMGKGRFILAESCKRPETNFLGIERSLKYFRIALLRQSKDPRPNCRFLCFDADFVVKLLIQPNTVTAYHVYFPDPWPKERHHKRRLFNPRYVEKTAETLVSGGHLYLKSDHEEYFYDAHERILSQNCFECVEQSTSEESYDSFEEASESETHFEIKWRMENRTIHSATYRVKK